jgi:hypothetical protein
MKVVFSGNYAAMPVQSARSANQRKAYLLTTRARAPSWTPHWLSLELFYFTESSYGMHTGALEHFLL